MVGWAALLARPTIEVGDETVGDQDNVMVIGTLNLDLLLGDVHSLKEKRSLVRPIVAELRKRYDVAAAEAGHADLHRRALLGVAVVATDKGHCVEVLDACERLVA